MCPCPLGLENQNLTGGATTISGEIEDKTADDACKAVNFDTRIETKSYCPTDITGSTATQSSAVEEQCYVCKDRETPLTFCKSCHEMVCWECLDTMKVCLDCNTSPVTSSQSHCNHTVYYYGYDVPAMDLKDLQKGEPVVAMEGTVIKDISLNCEICGDERGITPLACKICTQATCLRCQRDKICTSCSPPPDGEDNMPELIDEHEWITADEDGDPDDEDNEHDELQGAPPGDAEQNGQIQHHNLSDGEDNHQDQQQAQAQCFLGIQGHPLLKASAFANDYQLCQVREVNGMHPSTLGWLKYTPQLAHTTMITKLAIYTDASVGDKTPGWAFVALAMDAQGTYHHVGHFRTTLSKSGSMSKLVETMSSTAVESVALYWALVWITTQDVQVPVEIITDSQYAMGIADTTNKPTTNKHLAYLLASTYYYASTKVATVLIHVKGHSSQPWNEYADFWAKTVEKYPDYAMELPKLLADALTYEAACDWIWLDHSPNKHAYPPIVQDRFVYQAAPTWKEVPPSRRQTDEIARMSLHLATHNVTSLRDSRTKGNKQAILDALLLQYSKAAFHFVGQQESRLPKAKKKRGANWLQISSGPDPSANFGCTI